VLFAGVGASASLIEENSLGLVAEYSPESVAAQMIALLDDKSVRDSDHLVKWIQDNASLSTTGRIAAQWITEDAAG
jgi:hypothetical protein